MHKPASTNWKVRQSQEPAETAKQENLLTQPIMTTNKEYRSTIIHEMKNWRQLTKWDDKNKLVVILYVLQARVWKQTKLLRQYTCWYFSWLMTPWHGFSKYTTLNLSGVETIIVIISTKIAQNKRSCILLFIEYSIGGNTRQMKHYQMLQASGNSGSSDKNKIRPTQPFFCPYFNCNGSL